MKIFFYAGIVIITAALFAGCKKDNNTLNNDDKSFMVQAAYANSAAIAAGNLAVTKGMRDSIRIFGALMVTDHTGMQTTGDSLALLSGVQLPAAPDSLHAAIAQHLATLSGYTFDTAYIHNQVRDQQNNIRLCQQEITNGHNVQVKNLAISNLQKVQLHYNRAVSISLSE